MVRSLLVTCESWIALVRSVNAWSMTVWLTEVLANRAVKSALAWVVSPPAVVRAVASAETAVFKAVGSRWAPAWAMA